MSSKWKSSKMVPVDGRAFKRARLAAKSKGDDFKRGEYGHGSQEWLAEQARVSPRTVNSLETGKATVKTVDAVSRVLDIKGRKYIQGYGEDFATLRAANIIDFRPKINGRLASNEITYLNSSFLVTVDPIVITVDDDFIDTARLRRIELMLTVGSMNIDFSWLYTVRLTRRSSTWLGDEEDVREIDIRTREAYQQSFMFRQNALKPVSWKQFIDHIYVTGDSRILLTARLVFEHFEKQDHIIVSVEEFKNLLGIGYPDKYPYWIQPKALMVNSY